MPPTLKLIDRNKFEKLTPEKQRVAIAKDVLSRIKSDLIKPHSGDIMSYDFKMSLYSLASTAPVQERLNSAPCEVCAKGALLCSWVGNFNECDRDTFEDYSFDLEREEYEESLPTELLELFGQEQLDLIEAHFEGKIFAHCGNAARECMGYAMYEDEEDEANGAAAEYDIDSPYEHRIDLIMENIILNKGTFVPK